MLSGLTGHELLLVGHLIETIGVTKMISQIMNSGYRTLPCVRVKDFHQAFETVSEIHIFELEFPAG